MNFNFKLIARDKKTNARAGVFKTPHGRVETPMFVPVGTQATIKSLAPQDFKEIGVQFFFGNTYHLHLRPGEDVVREFGGLAKFMGWDGATITDSGGFQVFSLGSKRQIKMFEEPEIVENLVKINENGVIFRSHLDGSLHAFTPEKSIEIQKKLGADIILSFDECPPFPSAHAQAAAANRRTHTWAKRGLKEFRNGKKYFEQGLVGIIQGSIFQDLRVESAQFISSLDFDALAIGGVSVGESKVDMRNAIRWTVPHLPENKFRHLLGIGEVDDIFDAIELGIDTMDCVIPSRLGRTGFVFVHPPEGRISNKFRIDLSKAKYLRDQDSIDPYCKCSMCKTFSRGYLHHLFRAKELLAYRIATYHNVYFLIHLTLNIRDAILNGQFKEMKQSWLK